MRSHHDHRQSGASTAPHASQAGQEHRSGSGPRDRRPDAYTLPDDYDSAPNTALPF
ncbi:MULTISPECIES: hypothetical protein [Asticcacaulis]|uniref:hypothetical protein n=1 Tax=Asticcacaulis TaxID=76890 RepID=UPI001AEACE49|nr:MULTISPECIES: hypothetical protein [Asticcacaulis]MBP2159574.1 hypothetical protein [Asticcacaulis solisilvae]MDR6800599.1 hypothetical protein [Asticcacaulis sp. BE141]